MVRLINESGEILIDSKLQNFAGLMAKTSIDLLFSFFTGALGSILVKITYFFFLNLKVNKRNQNSI